MQTKRWKNPKPEMRLHERGLKEMITFLAFKAKA
jgi:hypothetical protein